MARRIPAAQFKPGRPAASPTTGSKGASGPTGKSMANSGGTTSKAMKSPGTNRAGGGGSNANTAQWKPGDNGW